MGGGHAHAVYRHGDSPIHRLAPAVKIVAAFGFVVAVVLTPREQTWAFGVHLLVLVSVMAVAGLSPSFVLRRMIVLVPFLVAAGTLPFLGGPPDTSLGLSIEGLWGMWNIVAKGSLGLLASVVLAATTEAPDVVGGLERLRMPAVVTGIMGFMLRYIDVVTGEFARTRVAMRSRGYHPRWLGSAAALGRSIGHLFVRSYERGERVFLAMVSRGYDGRIPPATTTVATPAHLAAASLVLVVSWTTAVTAMVAA